MLYLLLTTVMTKQLDAAVWILDSNELASFQHGDFLLHYCEPKPCSIVLEDVSKLTRKFEFSLVCFQLTLTYLSTVQLLAFLLLQCFILPHPLLLQISPLLFALLSFLFFYSYKLSCLFLYHQSLLKLCFPQNTALSPAIFF